MKRLGLLIIGDEILAGHTQDANTIWLAKRCQQIGVRLARVEVCTDDLPDLERSMRRMLYDADLALDYVVTSGGLGPTHDDRTMEGLAAALDVELEIRDEDAAWMQQRVAYGHELGYFQTAQPNEGMIKMTRLPQGTRSMPNNRGTALGAIAVVERSDQAAGPVMLFTLPGVPSEFHRMFDESVLPELEGIDEGSRPHVAELRLYTEESRFFLDLVELDKRFDAVSIGSYPQMGSIVIRATGPRDEAEAVIDAMRTIGVEYLEPHGRWRDHGADDRA